MASARAGINTFTSASEASSQSAHILRLHGPIRVGSEPNIIPIISPKRNAFMIDKMDPKERRKLQKKEQQYKSRAKKYKADNKTILAEKNEAAAERIRAELKDTRVNGKAYVKFVEIELCMTETPPDQVVGTWLAEVSSEFLKKYFGDDIDIITGAVHLDQTSCHSQFIVKPNRSWRSICDDLGGKKVAYYNCTVAWNKFVAANNPKKTEIIPIQKGGLKKYVDLQSYKEMKDIEEKLKKQKAELEKIEESLNKKAQDLQKQEDMLIEIEKNRKDIKSLSEINSRYISNFNGLKKSLEVHQIEIKLLREQNELALQEKEKLLNVSEHDSAKLGDDDDMSWMRSRGM